MKGLACFVFCIIIETVAWAQVAVPEGLRTQLAGVNNVNDAIKLIDSTYSNGFNLNEGDAKTYKKLMRVTYWAQRRQMPDGSAGDYNKRNAEAVEKVENQYGKVLAEARSKWIPYRLQHEKEWQQNPQLMAEDPNVAAMSAFGAWTSIGPQNGGTWSNSGIINADLNGVGRIDRIAFHPTNANILFVGTPSGGLWRVTVNNTLDGATYTCISDNLPTSGISGIAVSPTNGNVIYVLTGDGDSNNPGSLVFDNGYSPSSQGVYRTTNGGDTWQKMADFPEASAAYTGHKLTISNTNGNYLFAATSDGLYRTTDGAETWQRVRTGRHRDIEFKPGSDSVIYASTNNTVHYSTQGGRLNTWLSSTFSNSVANAGRIELAVRRTAANTSNNTVYALVGGSNITDSTFRGVFRSTNSGVGFTRQTDRPNILTVAMSGKGTGNQSTYDLCIAVNPSNTDNIITGGIIIWRSTNAGATMVNSLGDRYTRLLEKDQYASIQKFDLIGVGVTLMPNAQKEIMVGAPPIEGSAADRAGLHVGDFVTAVNGRPTKGRNAFDIIDQIAEESNAKTVTFTILRKEGPPSLQRVGDDSAGQTFDVTMERQTMKVKDPVQFKLTERRQDGTNVGYIRISEFNSLVNSSLQQALKELKKQGANAYVLDLRANTGGAFQSAVEISGMFLKDKVATYVVDRNNVELPFRTPKMQDLEIDPKVPMVIWLDGMSASASEVLAGSLHDNCRAVTMGDNSFGKGLIQAVYGLQNGAGLVVTVAQYITPSGTEIQGKGIVPDISGYMPAPVFIPVLSSDTSKVDFKDISQRLDPNMCHIPPDRAPSKPASESIVNSA